MKLPYFFSWLDVRTEDGLLYENIDSVHEINIRTFRYLMLHVSWIMAAIGCCGIFLHYGIVFSLFYFCSAVLSMIFYFIYRTESEQVKKYSTLMIHMCTLMFYALGIFLSVYHPYGAPHEAVTLTSLLVILPVLYIDRSYRVAVESSLVFVIHTVLAYLFKPASIATLDLLDTLVFALLGIFMGGYFRIIRLENFHKDKILIKQRDTDVLTGLANRRVLFSKIDAALEVPVKVLDVAMMDIDFFKQFNDIYGHQIGDECLTNVGLAMRQFGLEHNLTFCRYGGEEFTVIGTDIPEQEFSALMEQLLDKIRGLEIVFARGIDGYVTISAGYAAVDVLPEYLPEDYIKLADDALYQAKAAGRNRAVLSREQNRSENV